MLPTPIDDADWLERGPFWYRTATFYTRAGWKHRAIAFKEPSVIVFNSLGLFEVQGVGPVLSQQHILDQTYLDRVSPYPKTELVDFLIERSHKVYGSDGLPGRRLAYIKDWTLGIVPPGTLPGDILTLISLGPQFLVFQPCSVNTTIDIHADIRKRFVSLRG